MKHLTPRCWLWIVIILALSAAWWMDRQKLHAAMNEARRAVPVQRP
jgi:hypothetical protein